MKYPAGDLLARLAICQDADLIHAWGYGALKIATLASRKPILYTPLPEDDQRAVRWLLAAQAHRKIRMVCLSSGEHRLLLENGIAENLCDLIHPGVRQPKSIAPDHQLRQQLGFTADAVVVLATGESERHADHLRALHAVSILHFMDRRFYLLLWGKGQETDAVTRLCRQWGISSLVNARQKLGRDVQFEELIPVANMGLQVAPQRTAVLPLLCCLAGGLPMVALATHSISEIIENQHTGVLCATNGPRQIAQRILGLAENPQLAHRLADQARAESYELFPVSRFVQGLRQKYAELV